MKPTVKEVLLTLLCSIILFTAGWFSYPWFFEMAIPKVEGAFFSVTNFGMREPLKFSLVWAIAPIFTLLTWKLMPHLTNTKKIACAALIFGGILTAIAARRLALQTELKSQVNSLSNLPFNTNFYKPLSETNYEYWMTVGLFAGTILCFLFFRQKKKRWKKS